MISLISESMIRKIIDINGFVAEYEYHDLQINVPIADEEFTKKYKEYGF